MKRRGLLGWLAALPVLALGRKAVAEPPELPFIRKASWFCCLCPGVGGTHPTTSEARQAMAAHYTSPDHLDRFDGVTRVQVRKGEIKRRRRQQVASGYAAWAEKHWVP